MKPVYWLPILVVLLALIASSPAAAGGSHGFPLHRGSTGRHVADLQWLLAGHKPSVYSGIHTYKHEPTGSFGLRTARAVRDAWWYLGAPKRQVRPRAPRELLLILEGKKPRPLIWIGRASNRARGIVRKTVVSICAGREVRIARAELGVHEIPDGSNDSPRIRVYQAVTGAFRAPWCASFVQWVFLSAGVGTIADRSAGVFYIVDWARKNAILFARPRVGDAVAFLRSLGHIGIVERLDKSGFWTIEGNSGNAVREHHYPFGYDRTVFIHPACYAGRH